MKRKQEVVSNPARKAKKQKVEVAGSSEKPESISVPSMTSMPESGSALMVSSVPAEEEFGYEGNPPLDLVTLEDWINDGPIFNDQRADRRIIEGLRCLLIELQKLHEEGDAFDGFFRSLKFELSKNRPHIVKVPCKSSDTKSEVCKDLRDLRRVVTVIAKKAKGLTKQSATREFIFEGFLDPIYWPSNDSKLYKNAYLIYSHPIFYDVIDRYLFIQSLKKMRKVNHYVFDGLTPFGIARDWAKSLRKMKIFEPAFSILSEKRDLNPQSVKKSKGRQKKPQKNYDRSLYERKFGVYSFVRNCLHHLPKDVTLAEMENQLYFNLPHVWSGIHHGIASVSAEKFVKIFRSCLKDYLEDGSSAFLKKRIPPVLIEYKIGEESALAES